MKQYNKRRYLFKRSVIYSLRNIVLLAMYDSMRSYLMYYSNLTSPNFLDTLYKIISYIIKWYYNTTYGAARRYRTTT